MKMSKDARRIMEPWGNLYARLIERIENMPTDRLLVLKAAAQSADEGNCWFAVYRAAQFLLPEISGELARRERATANSNASDVQREIGE